MRRLSEGRRAAGVIVLVMLLAGVVCAQEARNAGRGEGERYSESGSKTRTRTASSAGESDPTSILRAARTIYIEPSKYIDSKYLEYKLGKHSEFQQWKLAIVKDREKADLVLSVHQRMLNYIFSIEDPRTSIVVVNGKVVAINDLVAAEDISKEIIRRMKNTRALAVD